MKTLKFLAPWLAIGLIAGGILLWIITSCDLSAPVAGALAAGYVLAAIVAAWIINPLRPE